MKKSLAILLSFAVVSITATMDSPLYQDLPALQEEVQIHQKMIPLGTKDMSTIMQYGAAGAAAGGMHGAYKGVREEGFVPSSKEFFPEGDTREVIKRRAYRGAGIGALAGGSLAAVKTAYTRKMVSRRINTILRQYDLPGLSKLPLNEATLVYAAYNRDIPTMRYLTKMNMPFVDSRGVLSALAHLYYKRAVSPAELDEFYSILVSKFKMRKR